MRLWSIVALLAVCATAWAASMEDLAKALPPCALECFIKAIPASPCGATNQTCLCTDPGFTADVETCVAGSCTIRQSLTTKNVTYTMCDMPVRDRTKLVSITGLAGVGIAFLVFCLRIIARLPCCGGQIGWDDWAMVLTMCCVIPLSALSWVLADDGLGLDMWTVPFDKVTHILYVYFWDEILYLTSVGLTKISILCFYLRVFPRREIRRLIFVAIGLNVSYIFVFNIITIFQCKPVQGAWLRWDEEHEFKCNNVNGQVWCSAIFNIILDVIVMALPLRELYMLNLSWRKKAFVMCMFSLGIFVTLISVIRLDALIVFANTQNLTWDYVKVGYWSTIEVHVGVICACLPALRSLFRRIWPCVFGDTQTGTSQGRRTKSTGTGSRSALKHGDDHFVPLVDMANGNGSSATYNNDHHEHNGRF